MSAKFYEFVSHVLVGFSIYFFLVDNIRYALFNASLCIVYVLFAIHAELKETKK